MWFQDVLMISVGAWKMILQNMALGHAELMSLSYLPLSTCLSDPLSFPKYRERIFLTIFFNLTEKTSTKKNVIFLKPPA